MRSSLLFSPKEAGAGPTQTYLLSSSTWTPIEWNSLRLLFSVSESEIVSTWGQDWGSQWQGLDRGQDQGHKPALWETGEQKLSAKPMGRCCKDSLPEQEKRPRRSEASNWPPLSTPQER